MGQPVTHEIKLSFTWCLVSLQQCFCQPWSSHCPGCRFLANSHFLMGHLWLVYFKHTLLNYNAFVPPKIFSMYIVTDIVHTLPKGDLFCKHNNLVRRTPRNCNVKKIKEQINISHMLFEHLLRFPTYLLYFWKLNWAWFGSKCTIAQCGDLWQDQHLWT